jgi:predicted nucleic acid-binding protein
MSRAKLEDAIAPGTRLVLDSSTILAYLRGGEPATPAAAHVIDGFVRTERNSATISVVTVAETLVRPFSFGDGAVRTAEEFLRHFPNIEIAEVDYAVARDAARLRAETNLRTPDALIIATASVLSIPIVVANDGQWAGAIATAAPAIRLVHLDEFPDLETGT